MLWEGQGGKDKDKEQDRDKTAKEMKEKLEIAAEIFYWNIQGGFVERLGVFACMGMLFGEYVLKKLGDPNYWRVSYFVSEDTNEKFLKAFIGMLLYGIVESCHSQHCENWNTGVLADMILESKMAKMEGEKRGGKRSPKQPSGTPCSDGAPAPKSPSVEETMDALEKKRYISGLPEPGWARRLDPRVPLS